MLSLGAHLLMLVFCSWVMDATTRTATGMLSATPHAAASRGCVATPLSLRACNPGKCSRQGSKSGLLQGQAQGEGQVEGQATSVVCRESSDCQSISCPRLLLTPHETSAAANTKNTVTDTSTFSSSRLFQENQVVFVSASITSTIQRRHAS